VFTSLFPFIAFIELIDHIIMCVKARYDLSFITVEIINRNFFSSTTRACITYIRKKSVQREVGRYKKKKKKNSPFYRQVFVLFNNARMLIIRQLIPKKVMLPFYLKSVLDRFYHIKVYHTLVHIIIRKYRDRDAID
jgi:hypothetical protein